MNQINKKDSRGLNEAKLRQKITNLRPDFVYVHLEIYDIMQKELLKFEKLPLFTADPNFNNYVTDLRNELNEFVDWFEESNPPQPLHVRKLEEIQITSSGRTVNSSRNTAVMR